MKVSEQLLSQAIPIINKIALQKKLNGGFAYYEADDVFQEVYLLCLDALSRYNPDRGILEHFLNSHISRRLKNLKRDRYFRPGTDVASSGCAWHRINLVNALSLESNHVEDGVILGSNFILDNPINYLEVSDEIDNIINILPSGLSNSFKEAMENNNFSSEMIDSIRNYLGIV